jgi:hypothetical protein
MDKGTKEYMSIARLPNGGYVVSDLPSNLQLAAFSTIHEALEFIKHAIEPVKPEGPDEQGMMNLLYGNRGKGFSGTCPA